MQENHTPPGIIFRIRYRRSKGDGDPVSTPSHTPLYNFRPLQGPSRRFSLIQMDLVRNQIDRTPDQRILPSDPSTRNTN